jgi:hypothetical protein
MTGTLSCDSLKVRDQQLYDLKQKYKTCLLPVGLSSTFEHEEGYEQLSNYVLSFTPKDMDCIVDHF